MGVSFATPTTNKGAERGYDMPITRERCEKVFGSAANTAAVLGISRQSIHSLHPKESIPLLHHYRLAFVIAPGEFADIAEELKSYDAPYTGAADPRKTFSQLPRGRAPRNAPAKNDRA